MYRLWCHLMHRYMYRFGSSNIFHDVAYILKPIFWIHFILDRIFYIITGKWCWNVSHTWSAFTSKFNIWMRLSFLHCTFKHCTIVWNISQRLSQMLMNICFKFIETFLTFPNSCDASSLSLNVQILQYLLNT